MQETVLTNTKFIRERQGDIVRDTVTSYKIVNQNAEIFHGTEYWPSKDLERKFKNRKNTVMVSSLVRNIYKEGKLIDAISHVNGCEGIEAIDKPIVCLIKKLWR